MKKISIFCFCLYTFSFLFSQDKIELKTVSTGLKIPVDIAFDGQNQMYVVEKEGNIVKINADQTKSIVLDITDRVNSAAGERGLLGLVFHPYFENNGYIFVNYTRADGDTRISRFKKDSTGYFNKNSEKILLTIDQPFNNHNAGDLNFGPDGYLYIAMGDGGSGGDPQNNSQNPKDLLGKMIRIDINTEEKEYLIPTDNPYVNNTDTLPEIFSMGLRNPWRFSFDQLNRDLWIADVGQNKWEEINHVAFPFKGKENYGWRCYEGNAKFNFNGCDQANPNWIFPIHTYATNSAGEGCSITGGFVCRDITQKFLYGKYVYGDYCTGNIWAISNDDCGQYHNQLIGNVGPQELSTFGEDKNGKLYFAKLATGSIMSLEEICHLQSITGLTHHATCADANDGKVELNVSDSTSLFLISGMVANPDSLKPGAYQYVIQSKEGCNNFGCFNIGIADSVDLQFSISPLTICEGSVINVEPNIKELLDEKFNGKYYEIYLDKKYYSSSDNWDGTFNESGIYSLKVFIKTCEFNYDSLLLLEIIKTEKPQITYHHDTLFFLGDYSLFKIFKDQVLLTTSNNPFYPTNNQFGTYQIVGINNFGCKSELSDPIIVNTINEPKEKWKFFQPNPTSDFLDITYDLDQLEIFNSAGHMLKRWHPLVKGRLSLKEFPTGEFLLIAKIGNDLYSSKLIIMR